MKPMERYILYAMAVFSVFTVLTVSSCKDDAVPAPEPADAVTVEQPEAWHDKTRTQPYPKMTNEIYLNPPPLIVPESFRTGKTVQFELSASPDFPEDATFRSEAQEWCMYNPHSELSEGTWYWRYRNIADDGSEGSWSETIPFEVTPDAPVFVTPDFNSFFSGLPCTHPRLYCFLDPYMDDARRNATLHAEYKSLLSRAENAVKTDHSILIENFSSVNMETVASDAEYLYQAYHLTLNAKYLEKLKVILGLMLSHQFTDEELFTDNFCSTDIAYSILAPYDQLYNTLDDASRSRAEELLWRISRFYFDMYCGMQENHIFDNHFWQQNMRVLTQIAFCLYDKGRHSAEAVKFLQYYYELWTARAPASGFNRDGAWINGEGYFEANVRTLFYMPMLFSHICRKDFLQHPWYRNAGQSLVYSWPPESKSIGFGDSSEKRDAPGRQRAAFADFIARETGDAYAGWYAGECNSELIQDVELRLYRMSSARTYSTALPDNAPKLKWFKDIGEVVMHSSLGDSEKNITLSFRSSTFGSGSHTLADQNSFNILCGGREVYYHTGYYLNFSDVHNLMSYRHTRAHNSILIDGIGQPFSTEGYGMLLRADGGTDIGYCLGDASHAYCGISDDLMWIEAFRKAGITQTPENGFGETGLTKYRRQMIFLYPDIILIYDELEASSPVKWEWLLHSPTAFGIDGNVFTSTMDDGSTAVTTLFGSSTFVAEQTDRFAVPPTATDNDPQYPRQWHLTASVHNESSCRLLALVQIRRRKGEVTPVTMEDGCIECGPWHIEVNLRPQDEEKLVITGSATSAVYSYGSGHVSAGGTTYYRKFRNSSVLYDCIDGEYRFSEQTDNAPASSRNG